MNGVLGPSARTPLANWGSQNNAGYAGASGATALQFFARGKNGGENILFFCCGVGFDPSTGAQTVPYPDSSQRVSLGVQLTTDWVQYTIPMTGVDLDYMLGGFGWVASATGNLPNSQPITFYIDDIEYLKERLSDDRFLVSYETIKSTKPFDAVLRNAAYVYDNSVAVIALLASGDVAHARTIADALVYAQGHDRFFSDGRVRNAYQGGDISLPPGWLPNSLANTVRMPGWYDPVLKTWFEDQTQVSTNTGNVAWAGLALLDMWEVTKDQQYLTAAKALGNWVWMYTREERGGSAGLLGGFTGGYDGWENGAASGGAANCASGVLVNGQCKRLYKSTEHNIDLYAMFSRLCLADGTSASTWAQAAQHAKHFFLSMWDPQDGKFWTGTTEDGVTVSMKVIPLDIQAWAIQALGSEAQPYLSGLPYVEAHHKTALGYGFKQDGGNSCGDHTWFEGTSQVAVAYLLSGNNAKWQSILDAVHSVQTPTGGVPATDGACLNTGFFLNDGTLWEYFPRLHVGATGWLALAENGVNPYRADLYSPRLAPSTLALGIQDVNKQGPAVPIAFSNPGVAPLSIRGVTLTGVNASEFQQSNDCGSVVPVGAVCTISISFKPEATGLRSATLLVTESSDPGMVPAMLSVNLNGGVTGPPVLNALVNAASFRAGAAPGMDFSLFGTGFSIQPAQAPAAPLPLTLGGVSVAMNGIPVPLFYAGPNQINGQIPYNLPVGPSLVSVSVNGGSSSALAFNNMSAAPGIFQTPDLACVAQNQDWSLNSPANPAKVGSILVVYLTGLGQVDNPVPTGAAAPVSPLSLPLLTGQAQLDGQATGLQFLGLAPGFVGAGQADVQVPSSISPGIHSLTVSVGGVTSNACTVSVGNHPLGASPSVVGIMPAAGVVTGGTQVTITGKDFQNGAVVFFGQTAAPSVTFISSTSLKAVTPPGVGVVNVSVTNPDNQLATLSGVFIYQAPPPATLVVTPASMSFNYTPGTGLPPSYFVAVTSTPNNGVAFTTSLGSVACGWLSFTLGSGVTPSTSIPAGLNTAVADGLSPGTYNCAITITAAGASNSPVTIPITLTLARLSLSVSPSSVTFNYPIPVPPPAVAPINVSSSTRGATVVPTLGVGCNWLNLAPTSGTTPTSFSPSINATVAASLTAGTYPCTVTFAAADTPAAATLSVTLIVASPTVSNPSIQAIVQGCQVRGTVAGVRPPQSFRVVVYALTNAYYIQPCITEPLTAIASDGTWGPIDSHNGAIYAILVQANYSPPTLTGALPAVDGVKVLAVTGPVGTISGCDVSRCPAR
jgi:uncharacterized protein (TIGR03437 family)